MNKNRPHFLVPDLLQEQPRLRRYFFGFFRRREARHNLPRPGAMPAALIKHTIEEIGIGGVVEILRIGYDGQIDDLPITIELTNITKKGFTGKVVSVERTFIEDNTQTKVYAKRGGGVIEFEYDDGDIREIKESSDYQELSQLRNVANLVEVLNALELQDRIIVAFFDRKHRGTINFEGTLVTPLANEREFGMVIDRINGVSLDRQIQKQFNIQEEMVIDVAIV